METVDLKQNERLNIDTYYYFTLYLPTGEILRVKNAGCTATLEDYLYKRYNLKNFDGYKYVKTFFNGTKPEVDLNNVYKKYHKYFKELV